MEDLINKIINEKNKLDKETPIPLYYQLKEIIKEKIMNKELTSGDMIPPEREISDYFEVSRPTVRQALNELAYEGLLKRKKGKGTFVANPKIDYGFIQRLTTFYDDMENKGYKLKTKILAQDVQSPKSFIANKLNIGLEEKVIFLKRLRYVEDEPIVSVMNFIPYDLCPGLEKLDLLNKSLYRTIWEKYNLIYHKAEISLEPVVADDNDVENLCVEKGAPIHLMKNLTYDKSGAIFDYFESRFRGDKGKVKVKLYNNSESNI